MPYKSDKQRRFMHAQHPEIAKRWDKMPRTNANFVGPERRGSDRRKAQHGVFSSEGAGESHRLSGDVHWLLNRRHGGPHGNRRARCDHQNTTSEGKVYRCTKTVGHPGEHAFDK